jgi:hypothetical protein
MGRRAETRDAAIRILSNAANRAPFCSRRQGRAPGGAPGRSPPSRCGGRNFGADYQEGENPPSLSAMDAFMHGAGPGRAIGRSRSHGVGPQ